MNYRDSVDGNGDVVPRDDVDPVFEDNGDLAPGLDEVESYIQETGESHMYIDVINRIDDALRQSDEHGYHEAKITVDGQSILLGEYLASDLFKLGLTTDELNKIIDLYKPIVDGGSYPNHELPQQEPEVEPDDCDCSCQQCENGGGIHCHNKRRGCNR